MGFVKKKDKSKKNSNFGKKQNPSNIRKIPKSKIETAKKAQQIAEKAEKKSFNISEIATQITSGFIFISQKIYIIFKGPLFILKMIYNFFALIFYFLKKIILYIIYAIMFPFVYYFDQEKVIAREEKKLAKLEAKLQKTKKVQPKQEKKDLTKTTVKKEKEKIKVSLPIFIIQKIIVAFLFVNYLVYRAFALVIKGIIFPFVFVYTLITDVFTYINLSLANKREKITNKARLKKRTKTSKLIGDKIKKLTPAEEARLKRKDLREKMLAEKDEQKRKKMAEILAERERKDEAEARKKAEEIYFKRQELYGKKGKKQKKKNVRDISKTIINFPSAIKSWFKIRFNNLAIVKTKQNRLALEREALLMSFDSEDAIKSKVKLFYIYVAKNPDGKIVKGQLEAYSKVEVHSYLLSEGYEVYSIKTNKWITFLYGKPQNNKTRIKNADLTFFLTQLSTYIKAGIPLVEALKILTKQYRKKSYQRIFKTIIYDLTMGENLSAAMGKQNVAFPRLLINMVKAAEMTGELPEALDNMSEYYAEIEKTRKQMVTALIYPVIVIILSIAVVSFIILFVIPRFVEIYAGLDADQIPQITTFIINTSSYMQTNVITILLVIMISAIILNYMYGSIKIFRILVQWLLMHLPVFKNIIIYNEVTIFSKTFSSLLSHNVFITDSMEVLNSITENEIYKMIILETVNNLAKGEKISEAFKNHWAFPEPAYEMLVTGEKTGQLPEMMEKVSNYYQELHRNSVTRLKTVIEPALIIFLTAVVGVIVLSVVIPMFNMFTMIQQ